MNQISYTHGMKWRDSSNITILTINFENSTFEFKQSNFNDEDLSVESYWNTLLILEGTVELIGEKYCLKVQRATEKRFDLESYCVKFLKRPSISNVSVYEGLVFKIPKSLPKYVSLWVAKTKEQLFDGVGSNVEFKKSLNKPISI
jgi:hypothetical protein